MSVAGTGIDRLVGVQVTNEAMYERYRAGMRTILDRHGGHFVVDVRVSQVLRSPEDAPFNRLFTIRFPSEEAREAFFSSPEYQELNQRLFTPSVSHTSALAEYRVL